MNRNISKSVSRFSTQVQSLTNLFAREPSLLQIPYSMNISIIFVFIILGFALHIISATPQPQFVFIQQLIDKKGLRDCGLLVLQDGREYGDHVISFFGGLAGDKPRFSIKHKKEGKKNVHFAESFSARFIKLGDVCQIVILFVADIRPENIRQIASILTPPYIPIVRKDVDFFIFLTPKERMESLLITKELPARSKYKLGISLDLDTDTIGQQNNDDFQVKTVCFFCLNGNPLVINWDAKFNPNFNYYPDFVLNLHGRLLQIAAPYIRARIEVDAPWTGVMNARRGPWKILLEEYLMPKVNFTYRMFASTGKDGNLGGGGTGLLLENGTWIGVTGDLITGKADLGVMTAGTPKRILVIDFTDTFFDFDFLTFVTSEGKRVYSPLAILWPFDSVTWLCILLSIILAFAYFHIMIKFIFWLGLGSLKSLNFARRGQTSKSVWRLEHQIQFVITAFLEQDCVMPIFTPLRCFVAIYLFFTLVATTMYRTKLVSLLAYPTIEELPTTFDKLAYSEYKVGFMKHGDSAYNTLAASTEPVYVKLIAEMELIRGIGLECLQKVVTSKYGCIAYDSALTHLRERNLSLTETRKLVIAPAQTYIVVFGISFESHSIYKETFTNLLRPTRAFHLQVVWEQRDMYEKVRRLKFEWWAQTNQSYKANIEETKEENLTLEHISGAFCLHFGLLIFCGIAFLWENVNRIFAAFLKFFVSISSKSKGKKKDKKSLGLSAATIVINVSAKGNNGSKLLEPLENDKRETGETIITIPH